MRIALEQELARSGCASDSGSPRASMSALGFDFQASRQCERRTHVRGQRAAPIVQSRRTELHCSPSSIRSPVFFTPQRRPLRHGLVVLAVTAQPCESRRAAAQRHDFVLLPIQTGELLGPPIEIVVLASPQAPLGSLHQEPSHLRSPCRVIGPKCECSADSRMRGRRLRKLGMSGYRGNDSDPRCAAPMTMQSAADPRTY